MKCVRCSHDHVETIAKAPDGSGAWTVMYCERCNFSWRNTEEAEVIDPAKRDKWFQLEDVNLDQLLVPCPIPPLKKD